MSAISGLVITAKPTGDTLRHYRLSAEPLTFADKIKRVLRDQFFKIRQFEHTFNLRQVYRFLRRQLSDEQLSARANAKSMTSIDQ